MRNKFLAVFVCVAVLAWWLNDPIPQDFSQPWKLRAVHGIFKVMFACFTLLDKAGLAKEEALSRSIYKAPETKFPDGISVTDELFDGVPVRIYRHENITEDQPGLIYYHGGGWVYLSPKAYDPLVVDIMTELKIVVVSVDYRLAPEHIFPAAFDDCIKATKHFFKNAKKLGVDPRRVAIAGDSAGGNLAAAVGLKLKDEKLSMLPAQQILLYPVLQGVDLELPSYIQNSYGPMLTRASMGGFISNYAVGSRKYKDIIAQNLHVTAEEREKIRLNINHQELLSNDPNVPYKKQYSKPDTPEVWKEMQDAISNPYFSPLLADDLKGIPETYVFTAQYDVLRDEALLYIKRLHAAGVKVTHVHGKNSIHGACSLKELFFVEGQECVSNFVSFLKKL